MQDKHIFSAQRINRETKEKGRVDSSRKGNADLPEALQYIAEAGDFLPTVVTPVALACQRKNPLWENNLLVHRDGTCPVESTL